MQANRIYVPMLSAKKNKFWRQRVCIKNCVKNAAFICCSERSEYTGDVTATEEKVARGTSLEKGVGVGTGLFLLARHFIVLSLVMKAIS